METRKVALIVFYDGSKRILLQDRNGIAKHGEGWGFFGGGIEKGETPKEAVVRETKEELSIDLKNYKFIGRVKGVLADKYIFISKLGDISKLKQNEGRAMKLFTIKKARKLKMGPEDSHALDLFEKVIFRRR